MASLLNSGKSLKIQCPIIFKLFQNIEKDRILPNTFYKARITQIFNLDRNTTKTRKLQANIIKEYTYKNLFKMLVNWYQQ
jgi:hypothetical protein